MAKHVFILTQVILVATQCGRDGSVFCGPTGTTDDLNSRILSSSDGVYTSGGKGVIVRNPFDWGPDHSFDDPQYGYVVVPTTFWHNDIFAPSQMYAVGPNGDINCPNDCTSGFYDMPCCEPDAYSGDRGPWSYAGVSYVIGTAMPSVFSDFENIQDDDWQYGVFYATDSNSVDSRCRYWGLADPPGFDCPGFWIPEGGLPVADDTMFGTGRYVSGNPYVGGGGGGAGCHWSTNFNLLDQTEAVSGDGMDFVMNADCQCHDYFTDNWDEWIDHWMLYGKAKYGTETLNGWFQGGIAKAPSQAVDLAACWVSNPRQMIKLQNAMWWRRTQWNNQICPKSDWDYGDYHDDRAYWGWNEVPMLREDMANLQNHDAVVIKLPAGICDDPTNAIDAIDCMSDGGRNYLEDRLLDWQNQKLMVPGADLQHERPGSYVVIVREVQYSDYDNWYRQFFCQYWVGYRYQINYIPEAAANPFGSCYIEYA